MFCVKSYVKLLGWHNVKSANFGDKSEGWNSKILNMCRSTFYYYCPCDALSHPIPGQPTPTTQPLLHQMYGGRALTFSLQVSTVHLRRIPLQLHQRKQSKQASSPASLLMSRAMWVGPLGNLALYERGQGPSEKTLDLRAQPCQDSILEH